MNKTIGDIWDYMKRNRTKLMIYGGIGGMWFTVAYTAKYAPVVKAKIEEAKTDLNRKRREAAEAEGYAYFDQVDRLSLLDTVKVAGKYIILPVFIGGVSTWCLVKANSRNEATIATLAAAYSIADKTASEYKAAVKEVVGEKKETEIRDTVAKNAVVNNPPTQQIIINGDARLYYDKLSGRYFQSDQNTIDRVCNVLNKRMRTEHYITLNEFYLEIGLQTIGIGDSLGWDLYHGDIEPYISHQPTINNMYCAVMDFMTPPRYIAGEH